MTTTRLRSSALHAARRSASWWTSIKVVTASRLLLLGVAYVATWFLTDTTGPPRLGFYDMWNRFDAGYLIAIAEHGYRSETTPPHAAAFLPLYPLMVRALATLGLSPIIAGMAVSAVGSLVACRYLYLLVEREYGPASARRAVEYLCFFPTAVFLVAPYAEAVFLAGAVAAFYYARAGRWLLVAPFLMIATGTRLIGVFVLAGIVAELLRQDGNSWTRARNVAAALVAGLAPLIAYAVFLHHAAGDALLFLREQQLGWHRELVGPLRSLQQTLSMTTGTYYPTTWMMAMWGEIVAAIAGVAVTAWALLKREWGYAAFVGTLMAAMVSSTYYFSIPRMLLSAFPVILFMVDATHRDDRRQEIVLVTSAAIAAMGTIFFTQGSWFY